MRSWLLIVLLSVSISGCMQSRMIVLEDYQPIVSNMDNPEVEVALRIESEGLAALGTYAFRGVLRDGFGEMTAYRLDLATVQYVLRAATEDALRLARIRVSAEAPRVLVVKIFHLSLAVSPPDTCIVVGLSLEDQQSTVLWRTLVGGSIGRWAWSDVPNAIRLSSNLPCFTRYAEATSNALTGREFQRQLY
jgi:hypothetical protein